MITKQEGSVVSKRLLRISAWTGLLLSLFGTTLPALAADPVQSITASPTNERISLAASGTYDGLVKITNTGETGYQFTTAAKPFSVSGENYDQSFTVRPDLVDASKWFSFPKSTYSASPKEEVAVAYHIKVPADIAAGGYYAVIFAETQPPATSQGITAHKRVGVLVYLTVTGNVISSGNVAGYDVPVIHTQAPLQAGIRIQNTGNVHFDATVSLVVSDMFGNTKTTLETTNLIFPKSTRKLELDWAKAPSFGIFRVAGTVTYLGKTQALPDRYTLMLSATGFLVIFGVGFVILAYAYFTRKRRGNVVRRRR
jgi:hypothetical protein